MITLILSVVSFIIIFSFILSVIYYPKLLNILIPIIFGIMLEVMTLYPNYEGYAVDSKFIPLGSEASVLAVTEGKDWIYLTLTFPTDTEPRLVKIIATADNKKQAEDALEKAQNGPSIIRFNKNLNSENSNNKINGNKGNSSGQTGDNGAYGSEDSQDVPGVSIQSINVNESKQFQKQGS